MGAHTVLVVGHDPQTRQTLAALLDYDGLAVVTEDEGTSALEQLRSGLEPCLIVLDLDVATRRNGLDFRRAQQADPKLGSLPVAAISSDPDAEHEAATLGIRDFVRKPVLVDAVVAIVNRHCQRRHR